MNRTEAQIKAAQREITKIANRTNSFRNKTRRNGKAVVFKPGSEKVAEVQLAEQRRFHGFAA